MRTGRKSILFGVHQFIWHPITVLLAWIELYGFPNWKEIVCIIIHDWGYWFCEHMDDLKGKTHPAWAADKAMKWFGPEYYCLCLYHSRAFVKKHNRRLSKLGWADKLSLLYDPWWFYLPRAWLSGELKEYRNESSTKKQLAANKTHREWFKWIRNIMEELIKKEFGHDFPYQRQGAEYAKNYVENMRPPFIK